jgi:RimJ/RimL family protein N-acetyltransferase
MIIAGERCRLRPYSIDEAPLLARLAGEFEVARWMTATFPHPYRVDDARAWLARAVSDVPVNHFAIEVDGRLAGGAGLTPHDDERRGGAEFGYWLGPAFWGRGIATEAARLLAEHALTRRGLRRLAAHVFARNLASARVLEKCGFVREAVLREAFVERDGTVSDGFLYARLRSPAGAP